MATKRRAGETKAFMMRLDGATRRDLAEIIQHSRTVKTTAGVIRGVVMRYRALLRMQCEAEGAGGRLMLYYVAPDGTITPRTEIDVRI